MTFLVFLRIEVSSKGLFDFILALWRGIFISKQVPLWFEGKSDKEPPILFKMW